jgi:hypothetical protein
MLGSSWVAVQLVASQDGLCSINEWVSDWHETNWTYSHEFRIGVEAQHFDWPGECLLIGNTFYLTRNVEDVTVGHILQYAAVSFYFLENEIFFTKRRNWSCRRRWAVFASVSWEHWREGRGMETRDVQQEFIIWSNSLVPPFGRGHKQLPKCQRNFPSYIFLLTS